MHLKIVTVDKTIADEQVKSIQTHSTNGEFEILEDHSPLIAMTVPSVTIFVTTAGVRKILFTSSGVLKVHNNEILFITDAAEFKEAINLDRARRAEQKALQHIENSPRAHRKIHQDALARARARIKTGEMESQP